MSLRVFSSSVGCQDFNVLFSSRTCRRWQRKRRGLRLSGKENRFWFEEKNVVLGGFYEKSRNKRHQKATKSWFKEVRDDSCCITLGGFIGTKRTNIPPKTKKTTKKLTTKTKKKQKQKKNSYHLLPSDRHVWCHFEAFRLPAHLSNPHVEDLRHLRHCSDESHPDRRGVVGTGESVAVCLEGLFACLVGCLAG